MTQIFISYNRKAEAATKALAKDFEDLGHTVWLDQELSGGQAWWDQILAMVRSCDLFVFVLEPEALNSTACKREYGYAVDIGKPILPVLVSEGVNINLLPPALSQIQFVDYRKQDDRNAAFRLARALNTVPPPVPLPDPLPPPPEIPISYLGSLNAQVETISILTYEQQSALVFELKRSLRDLGAADDTRGLLEKLRRRRDLFATIAEEIDEILGSIGKAVPPAPASEITPPSPERLRRKETSPISVENERLEQQESQGSDVQPDQTNTNHKPTSEERVRGASLLAFVGIGVEFVFGFVYGYLPLIAFSLGGAIAGAISGTKLPRIIAAVIGMLVATLLIIGGGFPSVLDFLLALLLPSMSVLANVYIIKRKGINF